MRFYTWQLYCVTEGIQTQILGSDAGPFPLSDPPTQCPNNTAHTVQGPAVIANTWNDAPAVSENGSLLNTPQMCPPNWHFESRGIQVVTASPGSLCNRDFHNNDQGDATEAFYDSTNTLIDPTTGSNGILSTCTKTIVTWTPPYDYVLIRGKVMSGTGTNADIYAHVILAPNIPASYGGQKPMVTNINLSLMSNNTMAAYDGTSPKHLYYNNGAGSNTIQWIIYHQPGAVEKFEFISEIYRQ